MISVSASVYNTTSECVNDLSLGVVLQPVCDRMSERACVRVVACADDCVCGVCARLGFTLADVVNTFVYISLLQYIVLFTLFYYNTLCCLH